MSASAWGVDHEVSKAIRSDEPKFKVTAYNTGKPIDTANVNNTGKKSLIRRRPKYTVDAFNSKIGAGDLVLRTKGRPTKEGQKFLSDAVKSNKKQIKNEGVTYRIGKSAWGVVHKSIPGATLGQAARAASVGAKPKVTRMGTAFPGKDQTKPAWAPKTPKAGTDSSFTPPGKRPANNKRKIAMGTAGGAGVGLYGGANYEMGRRSVNKALNIKPLASAGKRLQFRAKQAVGETQKAGAGLKRGFKTGNVSAAKPSGNLQGKSYGRGYRVGAEARQPRNIAIAGGAAAVGTAAGAATHSGIKRSKAEGNQTPNKYGY